MALSSAARFGLPALAQGHRVVEAERRYRAVSRLCARRSRT
jgi:hypothetical protein